MNITHGCKRGKRKLSVNSNNLMARKLDNLAISVDALTSAITNISLQMAHNVPAVNDVWGRL